MSPAENVLSRLDKVRQRQPGQWSARCPAHIDKSPSLSIRETPQGGVPVSYTHLDVYKRQRQHFEAVPIDGMFDFMQRLSAVQGTSARCLAFTILTACRSGESRGATWSEIDMDTGTWSIPPERMKASRPHRVPLSAAALALLTAQPRFEGTGPVSYTHLDVYKRQPSR